MVTELAGSRQRARTSSHGAVRQELVCQSHNERQRKAALGDTVPASPDSTPCRRPARRLCLGPSSQGAHGLTCASPVLTTTGVSLVK